MRHTIFSIPVKNGSTGAEVVLTDSQIKFIHLESRGFTQHGAAKYFQMSRGTLHNALVNFNSQTGCRNAQGRVGWALEQGLLIVKNKEILIAPKYKVGTPVL